MNKRNAKSIQSWSWILLIIFLILSIINYKFGLLGIICMSAPLYHAIRGNGKIHCSHYCPRGSLLGKFLSNMSLKNKLPDWMRSSLFKNIILTIMLVMLSISMYHANHKGFNLLKTGFALFRFMTASLLVGIIMGIFFKPRSWCQICPMGHSTALIDKAIRQQN
ncbi:4Fe-4S binding protein [Caloramator sp. E03]|uniref:4Fe-4S binding protein n=1 Tax=Caloramator sp. E03 TaxID=2576307 RepID=UPI001110EFB7|nr:4Fe-4S binding protein [Caloramator sp. E03]QCX32631.1 4Fe-4S binding protein [Caloramator sp. E03]